MPRFLLRNSLLDSKTHGDEHARKIASAIESEETLIVDERCRQSRSSFVEEKFSQLISLASRRYSDFVASTN